jgi:hypothetical protein
MIDDLTFVIFTKNEEKRIEYVLRNLKGYKVLVADNNSTDKTQDIVKKYNVELLLRSDNVVYIETKEVLDFIESNVKTNWIYWGYADELIEQKTLDKIGEVINGNRYDVINVKRRNYFFGDSCGNLLSGGANRIFKKKSISFENNRIHSFGKLLVPIEKNYFMSDDYYINHYISYNSSDYLKLIDKYTDHELEFSTFENTTFKLVLWYLVKQFLLKEVLLNKGYRSNFSSFSFLMFNIFYFIVKKIKIYEQKQKLTNLSIELKNNSHKKILIEKLANTNG